MGWGGAGGFTGPGGARTLRGGWESGATRGAGSTCLRPGEPGRENRGGRTGAGEPGREKARPSGHGPAGATRSSGWAGKGARVGSAERRGVWRVRAVGGGRGGRDARLEHLRPHATPPRGRLRGRGHGLHRPRHRTPLRRPGRSRPPGRRLPGDRVAVGSARAVGGRIEVAVGCGPWSWSRTRTRCVTGFGAGAGSGAGAGGRGLAVRARDGAWRGGSQISTVRPSRPRITKFGFRVGSVARASVGAFLRRAVIEAASSIRARGAPMQ